MTLKRPYETPMAEIVTLKMETGILQASVFQTSPGAQRNDYPEINDYLLWD